MDYKIGMRYPIGSRIQRNSGYVYLKTTEGMKAEHRWVAEQRIIHRPLQKGEVVIRRKPDRMLNTPENLVVVQHALEKFKYLPHARVIYIPGRSREKVAA